MRTLNRFSLALFLIGVILIAFAFTKLEGAKPWFCSGGLFWVTAYFLVLFDNFIRKEPIQTRGGLVKFEDGPVRYAMPYIPLVILGLGLLVVIVSTLLFP
jgi:hypothetical protein